jgi:ribosome recycling factor
VVKTKVRWFIAEGEKMIQELKKTAEGKMQKSLEALKNDLQKIRTGRAHTGLLDHVQVDYYGSPVPVNQVANITLIDARTIGVQPWEKGMAQKVEKAIRDSDLGLNPASQGDLIRVPMPALTEERRKEMIKIVKTEGEGAKVAIRNLRRDANTHLKDALKKGDIPEDDERKAQDDIQKLTDKFIVEVDKMLAAKEAELMQV